MGEWSFAFGAFIGSIAWLYQKAWERRGQRSAIYEKIVRLLPSITLAGLDVEKLDQMLEEGRVLWLHAPDDVVLAFQSWMATIQNGDAFNEPRLKDEFLAKMRHDLTFRAAVIPRFWTTRMGAGDFPVLHARK
ncbi:hypothetical protein HND92_03655 [Diaphorobacter sp. JS3050]|uniref:hypothetical protein n=1 Tax=Diaphorobacter sp. JS3050 TaxID=2735554 RepID=UPI001551A4BA|nr:hypothetical protein [Diaphorobacter sp. JS3050]QJY32170.1 hypothetical protein HND92_03655 [Diaphorobacter sp. JS3050]